MARRNENTPHLSAERISVGALERIRTSDLWYRKPALYPLSYEGGGAHARIQD